MSSLNPRLRFDINAATEGKWLRSPLQTTRKARAPLDQPSINHRLGGNFVPDLRVGIRRLALQQHHDFAGHVDTGQIVTVQFRRHDSITHKDDIAGHPGQFVSGRRLGNAKIPPEREAVVLNDESRLIGLSIAGSTLSRLRQV